MCAHLKKKWILKERIPEKVGKRLSIFSAVERQLLYNRSVKDNEAADNFLNARDNFHRLYSLKGLREAVEKIREAIHLRQKIVIFGDYDVDGVTATALLTQVLARLGVKADHYIPNRFDEGYGFSESALTGLLQRDPKLVITVDCGVRSIKEVGLMNAEGVDVIITDHHHPLETLPNACAIINPKQSGDEYPFKALAGVGIAYKLALALTAKYLDTEINIEDWLDLVALGTVADVASLQDENRTLVRKGLDRININTRPGIQALIQVSGLGQGKITAYHIGFMLGPRLNAAGRLSTAELAYELLMAETMAVASPLAKALDEENRKRQEETRKIQQAIEKNLEKNKGNSEQTVIFQCNQDYKEGVVGLAASRLADRYYRPSIVGTILDDKIRASCRSIPEVNINEALDDCKDLLLTYGGHAMAAGFSMETSNEALFHEKISAAVKARIGEDDLQPRIGADMELDISDLNRGIIDFMARLEPTGMDNPSVLFISRKVTISSIQLVGKEKTHLRFSVTDTSYQNRADMKQIGFPAIAFGFGHLAEKLKPGCQIDILYSFEINEFRGDVRLQLNIKDIRIQGDDD